MQAKEEFAVRVQMAEMHEKFIEQVSVAYDNKYYVEAVWYCYAIFEQRINRLIAKYIDKCTLYSERTDNRSVAISTRIACVKKLISAKYGAFASFDITLLDRVLKWCRERNELVHGLISLKHYKKFDEEFENWHSQESHLYLNYMMPVLILGTNGIRWKTLLWLFR